MWRMTALNLKLLIKIFKKKIKRSNFKLAIDRLAIEIPKLANSKCIKLYKFPTLYGSTNQKFRRSSRNSQLGEHSCTQLRYVCIYVCSCIYKTFMSVTCKNTSWIMTV